MHNLKAISVYLVALAALTCTSCGNNTTSAESKKDMAELAGRAAMALYVAIDKPSPDVVSGIRIVTDKLRENLHGWTDEGFTVILPEVEAALDKAFRDDQKLYKVASKKAAKLLLSELDRLFEKHPDWKVKGSSSAELVAAFCDGAATGLETIRKSITP
jgi:hypothetical protein